MTRKQEGRLARDLDDMFRDVADGALKNVSNVDLDDIEKSAACIRSYARSELERRGLRLPLRTVLVRSKT